MIKLDLKLVVGAGILLVTLAACCPEVPIATVTPTLPDTETPLAPSPDAALIRGPYLQSVTPDSVIVVWETDLPSYGEVVYGETEARDSRAADTTVDFRHAITLTGLSPYTTYYYQVENAGVPLSGKVTFRSAAAPDQTAFSFAVIGDTRTGHLRHRSVVTRVLTMEPDFVINTGDLVERGRYPSYWEKFFEIEGDLIARVPLFPTLGNHEGLAEMYFDLFYLPGNEHWYTFDYGHARFICLQVDGFQDINDPENEQLVWLKEALMANTQPWLFVYFHIPSSMVAYNDHQETEATLKLLEEFLPLFEEYDVDIVFTGHAHNYQRSLANGVTYVVVGGGGAPLYSVGEFEGPRLVAASVYHAVNITIDGNTLVAVAVTPEGEEIDRFTIP